MLSLKPLFTINNCSAPLQPNQNSRGCEPRVSRGWWLKSFARYLPFLLLVWAGNLFASEKCPYLLSSNAHFPSVLFKNSVRNKVEVQPEVTFGEIPSGLNGSLYRNGPGVFTRGEQSKNSILDADGFLRQFEFSNGKVRFRARMVETAKWLEEETAGKFIHPTWTTLSPTWHRNLFWNTTNQAGVSLLSLNERLFALDEMQVAVEVDPGNLSTLGEVALDPSTPKQKYQVHYRMDGNLKHLLSFVPGRKTHFVVRTADGAGKILSKVRLDPPRLSYIHDWAVTPKYYVFVLHPVVANVWRFLGAGWGLNAISESFDFSPGKNNVVWVVPRNDPAAARVFEAEGAQVWHILNAYDGATGPVIDFSANHLGEVFSGKGSRFGDLIRGAQATPRENTSFIRRYEAEWGTGTLRETILASDANYDFPALHPAFHARPHRYGFFARQEKGTAFFQGITRVDYARGELEHFAFEPAQYCMEPVFVPSSDSIDETSGWVLVEVFDAKAGKSMLAIFEAENLKAGPVGWVTLPWGLPVSFHGIWVPSSTGSGVPR
jgi:all-trans-8'-apo-beta-carotenal 15,15'-oxygenase